jgi:hypothetical protein
VGYETLGSFSDSSEWYAVACARQAETNGVTYVVARESAPTNASDQPRLRWRSASRLGAGQAIGTAW